MEPKASGTGDFVDRGAWGLETLIMLAALKLAAPRHVTLLRGNHESSTCTQLYGFRTELSRKYGPEVGCALLPALLCIPCWANPSNPYAL